MAVTTPVHQIHLRPGSVILLEDISWQDFETIIHDLGEKRPTRIAYSNGSLEIMAPLPEHERSKILIADIIKTILRIERRQWESFGSTTFKRESMAAGVEPDDCFYIQHCQAVIGKDRIDLSVDPPPDLAIEADVTSKTETAAYVALGVPELWIYSGGTLTIHVLEGDRYVQSASSPTFPSLSIRMIVSHVIEQARQVGSSQALLDFEAWLVSNL